MSRQRQISVLGQFLIIYLSVPLSVPLFFLFENFKKKIQKKVTFFFAILGNECRQRDLLRTKDYLLPAYTRMQEIDFMD